MTAQKAPAKSDKKRGDGPVVVTFVDNEGKNDYRRVPETVQAIQVADRNGKVKVLSLNMISPEMQKRFYAYGVANRLKSWIVNNSEKPDDVIELADELMAEFADGNMYSRAEGSERAGRKFDPTNVMEALKLAYAEMAKKGIKHPKTGQTMQPASDAALADFRTKLVAMTPKDRLAKLASMKATNPFYKKHLAMIQAKAIDTSDVEDEFAIL